MFFTRSFLQIEKAFIIKTVNHFSYKTMKTVKQRRSGATTAAASS